MARIPCRTTAVRGLRSRQTFPKVSARKHKIILESVTQEKKKLRSAISFESKPPPGYTFIPAGNPAFTNGCKELCRKDGFKVYTVSTTPHQRAHDLSQQVHRIGYHFPSVVVATICMERGLFLSSSGRVVAYQNHRPGQQGNKGANLEQSQKKINTEARDAIKDLFPNIPTSDLDQIINTAFRKGKRRVGTAVELPLARRAQLAVVAHIRHIYTSYDRLLKMTSFQEARATVEEPTLAKLVHWRGDDENGATVLEDVFREVIVISDDEEDDQDDDEETEIPPPYDGPRQNMELASSRPVAREIQPNYGVAREHYSAENPAGAHQVTGHVPSTANFAAVNPPSQYAERRNNDHRGFRRYEAWDRARTRYSNIVNRSSFVPAAPEPGEQYPPRYSHAEPPRPEFPGVGGHRVRLSPTRDPAATARPTDFIRREVSTDYPQPIGTYKPAGFTAPKEREPPRYHHPSDHTSFPPAFEGTQRAYVYRQSPVLSSLPRVNQAQLRRSYPPSEETRYGMAHRGHPHPQQGPINESRDYPILPSIESPVAPISRPERQEEYDTLRQSPKLMPGQPVSRNMRPLDTGLLPQQERAIQTPRPRQERHWDDLEYSRAIGPPKRVHASPRPGLYQNRRSPPVTSQPMRYQENLGRPSPGQRVVRVSQHSGVGDTDRYRRQMMEARERGISSHPAPSHEDPRRVSLRYPYPENPAIVIRQRHSMNSRLIAYADDPPTDAGNHLTQVRPGDARSRVPLEEPLRQSNRFEVVDKPYSYVANDRHSPGTYPSAASAFRSYRSPPSQTHTTESTPTISHTVTSPHHYIQGQQYHRQYL
ncbi:hypothetical protein FQN49_002191 [Arthroderma sp. PD_2]|nr:hypothetical protein FQN49_002191 [Arthroderma sp. PD_2]